MFVSVERVGTWTFDVPGAVWHLHRSDKIHKDSSLSHVYVLASDEFLSHFAVAFGRSKSLW